MPEVEEPKRGGSVSGARHNPDGSPGGGKLFVLQDTGKVIEEEKGEINIPWELRQSKEIHTFTGKNKDILNNILNLAGLSISDEVEYVISGDVVICLRSVEDETERTLTGTVEEIIHQINTSNGCKPLIRDPALQPPPITPPLNDEGGYEYSGESRKIAKRCGLVTLPKLVPGTNCGNCIFNQNNFCDHYKVLLPITDKMCCAFWDDKSFGSYIRNVWKTNFFGDKDQQFPLNDRGGYDYTGKALETARNADLITLPPGIEGTNCASGNCMYRNNGLCAHPRIKLPVTDRMACAWWDNTEVIRPWGKPVELEFQDGGELPKEYRAKDWQAETPHSPRWKRKKESLRHLSQNTERLRRNVAKDMQSPDERTALTALAVAIMDKTGERIGNETSAGKGHFGVTGFKKNHVDIVGKKIHFKYNGKTGVKQDKDFSSLPIANALKKAIRNSKSDRIFETSDGFQIKDEKVNRYLEKFGITAKVLRGYNANRWIIDHLNKEDGKWQLFQDNPEKAKKVRKKIFNKAVTEAARKVGHGKGTLRKHYMVPELASQYINGGQIIDMKNIGYYNEGSSLGDLRAEDYFANPYKVPDIVNEKTEEILEESIDEGIDKVFNDQEVKIIEWEKIVPTQDFLRSSKWERLKAVPDLYAIKLPWVIEYEGKYYVNDGHHRIIEMHERGIPIKAHVYSLEAKPIPSRELKKGIAVEKEHRDLYLQIKKRLSEKGIDIPITETEFYTQIAKTHLKEKKDYYDLLEKYVEKYSMKNGGDLLPVALSVADDAALLLLQEGGDPSVEQKIAERLQEKQKTKEFKDTGIAKYTRKYQAAYDIITSSDLKDIEEDNVTAYKLIEKSKIWPTYNVNELKEQGNTSGAAYLKVKLRESLSARPLDKKEAREVYVKTIERLRSDLESLKTAIDVKEYLDQFIDFDKMDLGDLSFLPSVSWISTSYTGNLKKYNSRKVEEYFNDIFGKKFYNFAKSKSDSARMAYAEAFLYEAYTKTMRDEYVDKRYNIYQAELKRYTDLRDKIEASSGTDDVVKRLIKESGIPYYDYKYDKAYVIDFANKYILYLTNQTKERIASTLSKAHTIREEDWSWSTTEKKAAATSKDEEGKPRKPESIFEKYGIDVPKVVKRTPLDYIKRTGGLAVGDISSKAVIDNYGFKNIIYGNYVNDAESKEHTRHILGAMLDMMELTNLDMKDMNKLGGLDLNIGATGCGPFSAASACYFSSLKAINLTKKRGDGSLGHEWAHYLDNVLAEGTEKRATNTQYASLNPAKSPRVTALFSEYRNWLMNGGTARKITVKYYPQKKFLYRIFGETLPEAITAIQKRYPAYKEYKNFSSNDLIRYYGYLAYKLNNNKPIEVELGTNATQFYIATSRYVPSDYFLNPKEMFARAFEGWLEYKLAKEGRSSNYLADVKSGMGMLANIIPRNEWPYPEGADVIWLDDWFERLFSAIRADYGVKPFIWGTKDRLDEYTDYKETKNDKVDAGVAVSTDGTVAVAGDIDQFEKGYAFRRETLADAKGENHNIYRLLTNPYSRGKEFAAVGTQTDVFIFASKNFTDTKTGYGIADGLKDKLPNIIKLLPDAKLEDAKKEAVEYFKTDKESKPEKPMIQKSVTSETVIVAVPEQEVKTSPEKTKVKKKTGKKLNTIHSCAVRLGRRGGKESAKVRAKMVDGGDTDTHDGSDVSPDSTEYLIDMELKPLIDKVRKQAFMPDYQAGVSDADVLGLIVSKYNRWDGNKIKETCYSAFEDANLRDAAEQVSKFVDGGDTYEEEGIVSSDPSKKVCGCFHTYLNDNRPELIEEMVSKDVNSDPELRTKVDEAYMAWSGGKIKKSKY